MTTVRMVLRFSGAALLGGLFSIAACAADSGDGGAIVADAGPSATLPEAGAPDVDVAVEGGPEAGPIAKCGNAKVEPGEQCDDGNTNDHDGCSASCALESAFEGDTCPGKALNLVAESGLARAAVTASTGAAFSHYGSGCGGGSGKDVVYTFTPTSSGKATVKLTADFAAIVSARSSCELATSESKCGDIAAPTGGNTTIEIPVFQGAPVFLIVDGYGGSSGTFTLDVTVSDAVCGNGIAELPEACDDGNTVSGDGCSATCALESGGVLGQCPGQPFVLTGAAGQPRKISLSGNTSKDGQSTQSPSGCFYWQGPNVVYALKSDIDGSANVRLTSGYAKANVHARSDCGSSAFQLGCTQIEAPGPAVIDFPVVAGQWFYVFVDGHRDGTKDFGGPYSLDVTVTPAACGNGTIDGTEECDDGNTADGDSCSSTCTRVALSGVAACPGSPVALTAQADGSRRATISSTNTGLGKAVETCSSLLSASSRGDAVFEVTADVDGYLRATSSGAFNTVVSISSSCKPPAVSPAQPDRTNVLACSYNPNATTNPFGLDGLGSIPKTVGAPVVAGSKYWVVVSNATDVSGRFKLDLGITPAVCGNGIVEGGETCDDGGTEANDGCSPTCQLEPITSRSTCGDAEAVTLAETTPGTFRASLARGTTNLLANGNISTSTLDDDKPCWAPGKNAFFSVTAPVAGVLRATAKSSAFDVVLAFRKPSCALTTTPFLCANDSPKGQEESIATPIAAGETVWIVVDSKSATDAGRFDLDVSVTPSGCADGFFVPSQTEQCDDGNSIDGDGCSATCQLETMSGVDVCPGKLLALTGTSAKRTGTITFSTASLEANYAGACGGDARDGVVKVVAPTSGLLRAKVRGMPGATLHARTVCTDPSSELAKSSTSTCSSVVHDTVTFSVTAGTEYFLFVDGLDGAVGVPTLDVSIEP